ncbi:MAG: glycosyltransferase family 39 protein [Planctomycetes bacterium]|nr:glycosyltransferase family 39 protein [Planctomycetota bacterium]
MATVLAPLPPELPSPRAGSATGQIAATQIPWPRLLVSVSPYLLVSLLFFAQLGHRDLYSSHEARAAQNAQRMLDTGEWGLPVLFDGRADLQKPPAFYWAAAAVGWLNGGVVSEWAVRFPSALAGLICVLLVSAFLRMEGKPTAAFVAAIGLATANHFTGISRTARIDVPLTCAVLVSLLAFYRGCTKKPNPPTPFPKKEGGAGEQTGFSPSPLGGGVGEGFSSLVWHLLSAIAAGIAVLLKGPVALALIGPAAVVWLLIERRHTAVRLPLISALLGPVIVAAVAMPWFMWVNSTTDGEFFRVFFWHHTIARYTGSSPLLATHPAWYYIPRFAVDFLPWTPALLGLGVWAFRSGYWRLDAAFRFGLISFVVMVTVLSTAKFKRADYLLPAFPFAAIAVGCVAEGWLATRMRARTVKLAEWTFGGIVAAMCIAWVVMAVVVEPREQAREEKRRFAEMIRSHAPAPTMILQFRMESHLLSYHLGRPVHTFVEWGELNELLAVPGPHFVVMPPEYVYPAGEIATSRKLVVIGRLEEYTEGKPARPLVFLRTAD